MTTVGEMIEHMDRPRLTNGARPRHPRRVAPLRQHHRRLAAPRSRIRQHPIAVGPVRRPRVAACRCAGTVIAGPRGIICTPPTGEDRIRSFARDDRGGTPAPRAHERDPAAQPGVGGARGCGSESRSRRSRVRTSAGSVGISQLLYSDGARARATIERHVQTSREQAREELRLGRGARRRGRPSGRAASPDLRAGPEGEPHPHPTEPRAGAVAPADRRRPRVRGDPLGTRSPSTGGT